MSWRTLSESDFTKTYVTTNVTPPNAPASSPTLFAEWTARLHRAAPIFLGPSLPTALLCTILVGACRGDLAASAFSTTLTVTEDVDRAALYTDTREALTLAIPFVGLPNTIPSLLGISGVLERSGFQAPPKRLRATPINGPRIAEQGRTMSAAVYNGVGNAAVSQMLQTYFPDAATLTGNVVFGWLMGEAAEYWGGAERAECVLVAAITAMGATRQARSHVKAAIGLGAPLPLVKEIVLVAREVNDWSGNAGIGEVDVDMLVIELEENLAKGVKGEPFV